MSNSSIHYFITNSVFYIFILQFSMWKFVCLFTCAYKIWKNWRWKYLLLLWHHVINRNEISLFQFPVQTDAYFLTKSLVDIAFEYSFSPAMSTDLTVILLCMAYENCLKQHVSPVPKPSTKRCSIFVNEV